jgi:hypothetical protein
VRTRLLGLPAAALAAGLPAVLAGLLATPQPAHLLGPGDDTVRTRLVEPPPDLALSTDGALDGAHPVTGSTAWAVQPAVGRGDQGRVVAAVAGPVHVVVQVRGDEHQAGQPPGG